MITHLSFSELSLGGCIWDFLWDVGWVVGFSFPSRVSLVGFFTLCIISEDFPCFVLTCWCA